MPERSGSGFAAVATPRALVSEGKMMQAKRIRGTGPTDGRGRAGALPAMLRRLRRREDGATAIMTGVMATVLIGFTALATEGGSWYVIKRNAQTAADTAAHAGAVVRQNALAAELPGETRTTTMLAAAGDIHGRNGFVNEEGGATTVRVRNPPDWGAFNRDNSAVGVEIERTTPLQLAALFLGNENARVRVRAVATVRSLRTGTACVLALRTGVGGIVVEGGVGGGVTAASCSLGSNAGITQRDHSNITAHTLSAADRIVFTDPLSPQNVTLSRPIAPYQPLIIDPFRPNGRRGIQLPDSNRACNHTRFSDANITLDGEGRRVMSPGVYCEGIDLSGEVRLNPGVYHIQGGDLTMTASANVRPSTGVTFVFTGNPEGSGRSGIGGPHIDPGASVDLTGGTVDYPAMLMYQDPRAHTGTASTLTAGGNITARGLFYFPSSDLTISGNFGSNTPNCKAFIGGTVTLTGGTTLTTNLDGCGALGVNANVMPTIDVVRLVE
jgi:Flp pilus assembly protein TadG